MVGPMAATRRLQNASPGGRTAIRTFEVIASSELIGQLVASYAGAALDAVETSLTVDGLELPGAGVMVRDAGSGRWLFLAAPGVPGSWVDGALGAVANGATAVITVDSTRESLDCAFDALATGRLYLAREVAREVMGRTAPATAAEPAGPELTARELQVLQLVAEGSSNAEIAEALAISRNTVRTHLRSLAVKMDAANRTRLLNKARSLGLTGGTEGRRAKHIPDQSERRRF
jgi:DNA-binding CsgD family transcriptional regulator